MLIVISLLAGMIWGIRPSSRGEGTEMYGRLIARRSVEHLLCSVASGNVLAIAQKGRTVASFPLLEIFSLLDNNERVAYRFRKWAHKQSSFLDIFI